MVWDLDSLKDIDSTIHWNLIQWTVEPPADLRKSRRIFCFIDNKYWNRQSAELHSVILYCFLLYVSITASIQSCPVVLLFYAASSTIHLHLLIAHCVWFHLVVRWVSNSTLSVTWEQERAAAFHWFPLSIHFIHQQESWRGERGIWLTPGMSIKTTRTNLNPEIIDDLKLPRHVTCYFIWKIQCDTVLWNCLIPILAKATCTSFIGMCAKLCFT